ncbi:CLAVATA3/ESR (CLE)-related protein 9 [Rhodamnia argentea]|uniref:CLAVATA3/ESR (CLE)-related protein 9 n=1 Tax=Rhodamnia argentea TaxID=178133 RepID=A0A8B8MTH6_9MYRT|nr:CLAVATA3/ESR (CLE)-related protein 9 [Rhodamnia argentea]
MKRPSSSSSSSTPGNNSATAAKFLVLTLLLFLHPVMSMPAATSAATSAAISRSSDSYGKSWRSHDSQPHHLRHHHSCDPSSRHENLPHYSYSLCFHLERIRRHQPPPPPDEIDPRYGVDKRLVPSGPNPLHN